VIEIKSIQNKDLVLNVSANYDPKNFNLNKYEPFIYALCGDREYQKEAIREVLRYFLGREYKCLKDLAEENYAKNVKLQERYLSLEDFIKSLQLPNKLSCSIDHATATGKSYVMYGVARILLAEGVVDQVLVLCPSNTIEYGLTEKFVILSSDNNLKVLLPPDSKILIPHITNASNTIRNGDICIENIHATYINTKSAIEDSLVGKGGRTLVLNDEAHHLMNPFGRTLKKWKEFLLDPKYSFKFIVNLSGTCYIGNDYFSDVIHRFSLRDAIEAKFAKSISYVVEDSSSNQDEKFQKIYHNHMENKSVKYVKVKPITILITKNISACNRLTDELITFIAGIENTSKEEAAKKVLIVTSSLKHKKNIPILRNVDNVVNPIEWITSVSMLTEGWDVKNVFQIVPHEERAFNSKLLIAQVLGRGLRIPEVYRGTQPVVTVFNHDRWSSRIKHLVDEVLEIEARIYSYPVEKREDYNFDLYNIDYKYIEEAVEYPQNGSYNLLKKGFIEYSSQDITQKETTYVQAISGDTEVKKTQITFKMVSIDEAINEVSNKLKIIDMDLNTNLFEEFDKKRLRNIIKKSLKKIRYKGNKLSENNLQKTLQAFGVVYREKSKSLRFKIDAQNLIKTSTKEIHKNSIGLSALRRHGTVFWDDYSSTLGDVVDIQRLSEINKDLNLRRAAIINVGNKYNFKTPLNVVLTSHTPERMFVQNLVVERTATVIDSWIKSPDVGFYSLDYSWRKGEHQIQSGFNPDFFIKIGDDIIVSEIKGDDDISDENKAKLRYARDHFSRVNELQKDQSYYFMFISPISYDLFFKAVREKNYQGFKSVLESNLEE